MRKIINFKAIKRLASGKNRAAVDTTERRNNFLLESDRLSAFDTEFLFDIKTTRKRVIFAIALLLFGALLQGSVGAFNLEIFDIKINIFAVLLLSLSTACNLRFAMISGCVSGLLIDIAYGRFLGFYGLIYMYFAVLVALLLPKIVKGRPAFYFWAGIPLFVVFELTEGVLARFVLLYATKSGIFFENFGEFFARRALLAGLVEGLLFMVLVWPVTWLWQICVKKKTGEKVFEA